MAEVDERTAVRRLHDRFGFGARPGELDGGFQAALTPLLDPAAIAADAGVRATPPPRLGDPPAKPPKTDPAAKKQYGIALRDQQDALAGWWLDRMVAAEVASAERITWFWHGHFATGAQKVRSPAQMLAQNETQRRLGMGGFAELARAMVLDPAMLHWLDGQRNRVGAPNENLAREFLELFALGIGHYTETDVREGARALTGWTVSRAAAPARLAPRRHDGGSKEILGSTGDFDAPSFVELALGRPESAPFVAGRLWFRLVSANPPAPDTLGRLVDAYGPGRDVRALLAALAVEPAFHDPAATLVKQPVEWLVGLMRALRVRPSRLDPRSAAQLWTGLRGMGQVPFQPPNVGGWAAGGGWLTTSAGLARLHTAQLVTAHADLAPVAAASTANRPDAVRELLGVDAWSDRTRAALAEVTSIPAELTAVAACAPEYVVSG